VGAEKGEEARRYPSALRRLRPLKYLRRSKGDRGGKAQSAAAMCLPKGSKRGKREEMRNPRRQAVLRGRSATLRRNGKKGEEGGGGKMPVAVVLWREKKEKKNVGTGAARIFANCMPKRGAKRRGRQKVTRPLTVVKRKEKRGEGKSCHAALRRGRTLRPQFLNWPGKEGKKEGGGGDQHPARAFKRRTKRRRKKERRVTG